MTNAIFPTSSPELVGATITKISICFFWRNSSLRHQNQSMTFKNSMGLFMWSKVGAPCAALRRVTLGWQWLWSKLTSDQFSTLRGVSTRQICGKSAGWIPPVFEDFHCRSVSYRFEAIWQNGRISRSTSKRFSKGSLGAPPLFKIACSCVAWWNV